MCLIILSIREVTKKLLNFIYTVYIQGCKDGNLCKQIEIKKKTKTI